MPDPSDLPTPYALSGNLLAANPDSLIPLPSDGPVWEDGWDGARIALQRIRGGEPLEGAGPAEQAELSLIDHFLDLLVRDQHFDSFRVYELLCVTQRNRIRLEVLDHYEPWRDGNGSIDAMFDPIREPLIWNAGYPEIEAFDAKLEAILDRIYHETMTAETAYFARLWRHAYQVSNGIETA